MKTLCSFASTVFTLHVEKGHYGESYFIHARVMLKVEHWFSQVDGVDILPWVQLLSRKGLIYLSNKKWWPKFIMDLIDSLYIVKVWIQDHLHYSGHNLLFKIHVAVFRFLQYLCCKIGHNTDVVYLQGLMHNVPCL